VQTKTSDIPAWLSDFLGCVSRPGLRSIQVVIVLFPSVTHTEGAAPGQTRERTSAMNPTYFTVYRDHADRSRWRLVSANGRVIAVAGESYETKETCLHDIELVKGASAAAIETTSLVVV
jgi:uncharacterized protein YegP (UPF0339 family)